jgi:hypothetical protein
MQCTITSVIVWLMLSVSVSAQEQPRELRGDGHLLGETVEQFFSEGFIGDILRACEVKDWKTVSQLSNHGAHASKTDAKDYCANAKLARQQATSGIRLEYAGRGDDETMRGDMFTFDAGHLVKIHMAYSAPAANVEGYHPKSYSELFAGLREAYGPPSKSYSEPMLSTYGVKYDAHRAQWMGNQDIISIIEQPREVGRTEIIAETLAEYNRAAQAPKTANPLR